MEIDTIKRSIVKTISWRITGSLSVLIIVFLMTGNIGLSSVIVLIQAIINVLLYFIHERIWNKITWGRK